MPDIVVAKPFPLTLDNGEVRLFDVGVHKDVDKAIADHWFVQHHLAVDGKLPSPDATSPLTHEERVSMKASLDAAEKRATDAEAEAKVARDERDGIKADLERMVADSEALRSRVASLEADLDKATKPAAPANGGPKPKP